MPDRAERERLAKEREARVRAERAKREQAAKEASARRAASSSSAGSRARPPSSSSGGGVPRGRDPVLVRYYERLEVIYGSDFETVKVAYRRLMRKYHPDMHANKSPEARRAATEVAQALTQAYNELEKVLLGGPNRSR
jgi:DnaJ like chaperone protein